MVFALLCQPVSAAEHRQLIQLADNIYSYIDAQDGSAENSFGANSSVIIGDDGIAVIDSRVTAVAADELIESIRKVSDKPIKYVINTHRHLDHTYGNCEFAKLGATIVMSSIDAQDLKKDNIEKQYKFFGVPADEWAGTTLFYPTLTFSDKVEIDLGNQKLQLIYPGPSHTAGSILVYLPKEKMLFTGDILTAGVPFMGDGNVNGWLHALDYVQTIDVNKIVPGHGPLFSKKDATEMRDYIALFDKTAKGLCAKSNDLNYITAEMKKVLPNRGPDFFIPINVSALYLNKNK